MSALAPRSSLRRSAEWLDALLVLVPLSASYCVAGSFDHLSEHSLLLLTAAVAASFAATTATRRFPPPSPAPFAWGLVVTVLTTVWLTLGSSTFWGAPTKATVTEFVNRVRNGVVGLSEHGGPWHATAGNFLVLLLASGAVASATASLWAAKHRHRQHLGSASALLALAPSIAMYCATAVADRHRPGLESTVVFIACGVAFLAVADMRARRWAPSWRRVAGALVSVLCAGGAVLVTGLFVSSRSSAEPASLRAPSTSGISTLALEDDLAAVEIERASTVVFLARTSTPTYWQVATLDDFDGREWTAGDALSGSAATATARPATTIHATVRIRDYAGPLLPVPPGAVRVSGSSVSLHDGVVTAGTTAHDHLEYEVTAAAPPALGSPPPTAAAAIPSSARAAALALPTIPARVVALAHRIVAGAAGPVAEAQALQAFFTSGRFRYTLSPGVQSRHGGSPLTTFLFSTHRGDCQQFAGAFGVLARVDGLPTRVAVGFTDGTPLGDGRYEVVGADAHAWPEAYLGSAYGWVSFDPTPSAASVTSPARTTHSRTTPSRQSSPAAARSSRRGQGGSPGLSWAWSCGLGGAALLSLAAALGVRRRRRRRSGPGRPSLELANWTGALVLAEWARAARALSRHDLERKPTETLREHADRVRGALPGTGASDSYSELAAIAGTACYSLEPVGSARLSRARQLADATEDALDHRAACTRPAAGASSAGGSRDTMGR